MHSKKVSVRTGIVVGIASLVVAGAISVAQAADNTPIDTALPAAITEPPQPITTHPSTTIGDAAAHPVTEVVQAAAGPATAVQAMGVVDRTVGETGPVEPATTVPEVTLVVTDRLVLVGDSLAHEVSPVIRYVTPDKTFVRRFHGGTAPCDWIDADLEATNSTVVVISFSGNNLTPCMIDETGANLTDEELVEKYRTDVGVLIDQATTAGAWVVLVGQPVRHPSFDADLEVAGINAVYQEYAAARAQVSYVDAGQFVEAPDGRYTDRMPCLDLDTDCAPDGTTLVRSDGIHFCPVIGALPCPVWSSGATRFGLGIAAAANDPQRFD